TVTIIPTALVAIPFGAVIALQVGGLIQQFGAESFTGSTAVLAVVQQAGPIATALLVAGAGGSAIAADLGARKIREELDAMMVLGINPIQRLVVPRVLACMLVAVALNGMVSVVGVAGGYVFNVVLQDGTPGAYLASFSALAQMSDMYESMLKALIFGLVAAIVAAYKGMTAAGGPKGVGDAVNESVVITFTLLFVVNFVVSAIFLQLVPAKGTCYDYPHRRNLSRAGLPPGRARPPDAVLPAGAQGGAAHRQGVPQGDFPAPSRGIARVGRFSGHRRHRGRHHRDVLLRGNTGGAIG